MDLDRMGLFKLMTRKMDYLADRQQVLAKNIANVNTPEYKPNDLKPFTFRSALEDGRGLEPEATNPGHLTGTVPAGMTSKQARDRAVWETTPDGNSVVVEDQMMKVAQTSADYQEMLNLYKKQIMMIKSAIRSGGA